MPVKKEDLTQSEICKKWIKNKNINPRTLRAITKTGKLYKELEKNCSSNKKGKLTENDICKLWHLNKNINPITLRAITKTGKIYKELEKKCSHISSISSSKSISTPPPVIKISSESKAKKLML